MTAEEWTLTLGEKVADVPRGGGDFSVNIAALDTRVFVLYFT